HKGQDLLGHVESAAPLLLKAEVAPKTGAPKFCRKLLAAADRCNYFGLRGTAFYEPIFSMWMQGDLHARRSFCDDISLDSCAIFGFVTAPLLAGRLQEREDTESRRTESAALFS